MTRTRRTVLTVLAALAAVLAPLLLGATQAHAAISVRNTAWSCTTVNTPGYPQVCSRVQYMKDTALPGYRKPIYVQVTWSPSSAFQNVDNVQTFAGKYWYLIGDNLPNGVWSDWAWRTPYAASNQCGVRGTLDGATDVTFTHWHVCN